MTLNTQLTSILGHPGSSLLQVEEMPVSEPIEYLITMQLAGSIFGHSRNLATVKQEKVNLVPFTAVSQHQQNNLTRQQQQ